MHKYYRTKVDTDVLRELHRRSNLAGTLHVLGHVGVLVLTGSLFVLAVRSFWWVSAAMILLAHGTVFSFLGWAGASHELSHGTAFRWPLLNRVVLWLFSFLSWGNHVYFGKTHTTHHKYTLDSYEDREVRSTRCPNAVATLLTAVFDIRRFFRTIRIHFLNARGILPAGSPAAALFMGNEASVRSLQKNARFILMGHMLLAGVFIGAGLWELVLLLSLSSFIGNGLPNLLAAAQHCGKTSNVPDYRDSTRTVVLHPVLAFFYWNMNYHVEHHMYPGVPFYKLPKLHRLIAHDVPPAAQGLLGILKEFAKSPDIDRMPGCRSGAEAEGLMRKNVEHVSRS